LHQISQRQKTQGERASADGCNSTDRPVINPAGRPSTHSEGDSVHSSKESDGRHSGSTDLDDDGRKVRQHGVRNIADEAHQSGPD
jgi:hypothetical protein